MPRLLSIRASGCLWGLWAALPLGLVLPLRAQTTGTFGEVISPGMYPFSETWDAMLARDGTGALAAAPGGVSSSEQVIAQDRPVEPRFSEGARQAPAGVEVYGPFAEPGPLAPQVIGTNFAGITLQDQFNAFGSGSIPPDTMGAVGPSHFMEVINSSAAIYSKTGTLASHVSLNSFFTVTISGTTYPRNGAFDPRVLFDRRSNRWWACALERGNPSGKNNHIILAVCRTSDPSTGTWDKYLIPVGVPDSGGTTFFTDFDTLGTDDNGAYFGMRIFPSAGASRAKIVATGKASLIAASPSLGTVSQWDNVTDMYSSPQPAHNHSPVAASGRAWFVASSTSAYGNVNYRTLTWSGGVPTLSSTSVLTTPAYGGAPLDAPASGSTTNINVTDDRLEAATIRNNRLWTSRAVGVDSSGGSSAANRTACEWLELNVTNATATLVQSGRVYDSAASSPRFYYYPSVVVSGQGHAAMGFSGSKSTEFVAAYTCGRLVGDALGTMGAVSVIKSGQAAYQRLDGTGRNRWGDYSFTSLDPNDDMTVWTIQEYASNIAANIWGTWVAQLRAPAPTLNNPGASGAQGQSGINVALTGTRFYDPGAGYTNRLGVSISGTGVTVTSATYNSATSVTITVDVAGGAAAGGRSITLTNPDGQSASVANGFTVTGGAATTIAAEYIFYNNSYYDANNPGIDPAPVAGAANDDDDAIDPTKSPLLVHAPAQQATTANYTSYDKGINGLTFDVTHASRAPVVGDFTFTNIGKAGSDIPTTVAPSAFLARPLPGGGPSDYRVVVTFANYSLIDTWLQCGVGTGFGLSAAQSCWWGNAVAETLTPSSANLLVNNTDIGGVVSNQKTAPPRISLTDPKAPYELNRDGLVNNTDIGLCVSHQRTTPAVCVKLIAR